jgi:hypothetical protein
MPVFSRPRQGTGLAILTFGTNIGLSMQMTEADASWIDAGGARALSQLQILEDVMLQFNTDSDDELAPCKVFDVISGVGVGGSVMPVANRSAMCLTSPSQIDRNLACRIRDDSERS